MDEERRVLQVEVFGCRDCPYWDNDRRYCRIGGEHYEGGNSYCGNCPLTYFKDDGDLVLGDPFRRPSEY